MTTRMESAPECEHCGERGFLRYDDMIGRLYYECFGCSRFMGWLDD